MHKFLFCNKIYYIPLHFLSTMCSSSGGQNCIIQHLVSSHSVCGRPVHRNYTPGLPSVLAWACHGVTLIALNSCCCYVESMKQCLGLKTCMISAVLMLVYPWGLWCTRLYDWNACFWKLCPEVWICLISIYLLLSLSPYLNKYRIFR